MFVWRELKDGDTVMIRREGERVIVSIVRAKLRAEQRVTIREVQCCAHDVVVTLVRRVMQQLKNHR